MLDLSNFLIIFLEPVSNDSPIENLDYPCDCKSEISNECNAVEGHKSLGDQNFALPWQMLFWFVNLWAPERLFFERIFILSTVDL